MAQDFFFKKSSFVLQSNINFLSFMWALSPTEVNGGVLVCRKLPLSQEGPRGLRLSVLCKEADLLCHLIICQYLNT